MDFESGVRRRQTPAFYRMMAAAYLQAVVDIEQGLDHETFVSHHGDKYLLPNLRTYVWHDNCKEHEWAHDGTNYRCILCSRERSLEPIHVELPAEILYQILSLAGEASSFCTRDLHTKYIYENYWQLMMKLPAKLENQYVLVQGTKISATLVFKGEKSKALSDVTIDYALSDKPGLVTATLRAVTLSYNPAGEKTPSLPAFIVSVYARLNKIARKLHLDKYKVTLLCREKIRKEFRRIINTDNRIFRAAYQDCSLLSFGVPRAVGSLMKASNVIAVFERAFAFDRVNVADAVAVILNAFDAKDRAEACYGFILLWFSEKYYDKIACCLREQAKLIQWK